MVYCPVSRKFCATFFIIDAVFYTLEIGFGEFLDFPLLLSLIKEIADGKSLEIASKSA